MKRKNTLEGLFEELQGNLDLAQPEAGHRERFAERLAQIGAATDNSNPEDGDIRSLHASGGKRIPIWRRPLSIAASVALLILAAAVVFKPEPSLAQQVAEIAPEVSETTDYFANVVEQEIRALREASSPETEMLIEDTLEQLQKLGADYRQLEQDLVAGGNTKLILSAMITNFQTRIDLLEDVMSQVDEIKQFKNESNEANIL
ncbi:hypothetical protein SAMN04490243_2227 [Robiginitalea myxolifaciens]|uniref:DUF4179 domain-containing protein n=1 Tax=Robiginitalea myxolifaciens TaxID=400055 RepID=A0A1I6H415_9FLAO|nr:hypothetical protein [Robiginitalea myxolifaciens]SFR49216.1 hypothetical protein SAMN04490243_2227 [Robiginitalea myxolifaciens]